MIKLLWNNTAPQKGDAPPREAAPDAESMRLLCEHFSIGRKIRYYPEYQRDIVFQTIVIAYRLNEHYIYSREAIRFDANGQPVAFQVGEKKTILTLDRVKRLQIMVPDTSDMERSLDYVRRANLGRNGQFVRGNAITLIADTCQRGIPSLETQVDSRLRPKDGPYMDNPMVLLKPDLDTLRIVDQRKNARVQGELPVHLYLQEDAPPHGCLLGDFSDMSMRLRAGPGMKAMPDMQANDKVVVVFSFGDAASTYRIRGSVFRIKPDSCVIKFRQLYKDGEFSPIRMMDILEIKTGLLNLAG
jgi:hypothetical protein